MSRHLHRAPRKGMTRSEIALFLLFLSIAGGSSVFFFFLSSREMKSTQVQMKTIQSIGAALDALAFELQYAVLIDHPFQGEAKECFFRRAAAGGALDPSMEVEGFVISEGVLTHVTRTASGTPIPKPWLELANPLVVGIQSGGFERRGPGLLRLALEVTLPPSGGKRSFERSIALRNQ